MFLNLMAIIIPLGRYALDTLILLRAVYLLRLYHFLDLWAVEYTIHDSNRYII